jgi:hypothetical protein
MRVSYRIACILAVATLIIRTASAQQDITIRLGPALPPSGLAAVAANETVQKDIGVSVDTGRKLVSLRDAFLEAVKSEYRRVGVPNAPNLRGAARQFADVAITVEQKTQIDKKLTDEFDGKVKDLLSVDQFKRLKQIQIQSQGSAALNNPEMASELKLSDDQKKQLTELAREFARKQFDLFRDGGKPQERLAKRLELNTERDNKAIDLLTNEQKEKFAALKGSTFDTSPLGSGGRGGKRGKN